MFRQPVSPAQTIDKLYEQEVAQYISIVIQSFPASESKIKQIKKKNADDLCSKVQQSFVCGWPAPRVLKGELKHFWQLRHKLCVHHNLLSRGSRIVSSSSLRDEILRCLHSSHQCIVKCRERSRQSVGGFVLVHK